MKVVNYLNIIFNLNEDTYRLYQRPDNIIQYIHVEYIHPPNIIKQIFEKIEKCFSQLPLTKKYSMNQYPSIKINYKSLVITESESINQL